MTDVSLFDEQTQALFRITSNGEIVVADYSYSDTYFAALVDTEPFEIVPSRGNEQFVTTAFWISALKTVSNTDAGTTVIYEAAPDDLSENLNTLANVDLIRNQQFPSPAPLRMRSGNSRSIVVSTTDPSVNVTVVGYYVPVRPEDA